MHKITETPDTVKHTVTFYFTPMHPNLQDVQYLGTSTNIVVWNVHVCIAGVALMIKERFCSVSSPSAESSE